jgi:hypothetical protein
MMPLPVRKILKQLIFFAKREFKEKKPISVQVVRVKAEQVLTRGGPLKEFSLKQVIGAYYLVIAEYKEVLRSYYYSKEGKLLEAKNLEKTPKLLQELQKSTIREFQVGKQKH